jgi:hypothetical protein
MILEVGKAGKCRFIRGIKKTNIFEIGEYGMVVEREKHDLSVYATNNRCSKIFAVISLGDDRPLLKKKPNFMAAAYAYSTMVLDCGDVLILIDYEEKKVAVNDPGISVTCREEGWSRMEWEPYLNAVFGLPVGEADQARAEELRNRAPRQQDAEEEEVPPLPEADGIEKFWDWFAQNEDQIVEKTLAGGEEAEIITARIRVRLAGVFPYAKPSDIEFQLTGDGEKNQLAVYHFNRDRMKADAEELCSRIPEELRERWGAYTEA